MNRLFLIPPHRPSKQRLIHAWNAGLIHRYVAVIEEGMSRFFFSKTTLVFYQSPMIVFKMLKYLIVVLVFFMTVCLAANFYESAIGL